MTYFEGFIVPVPADKKAEYEKHASRFAPMVREFGVRRMVENWDSDIPEGKVTDFRKAVDAMPEEKIVFSWFEYPSRAERDAANAKMMSDPRMEEMGKDMPFDGKRMIMGGFDAIVEEGSGGGAYTDGIVVPVPEANREGYRQLAAANAKVFIEHGASRVIETLGDDVARGQVTDFYRAVQAKDGETIAFSFIQWPDKATRDQAWQKIMADNRMQHGGKLFEGSRMFWGGFEQILDTGEQAAAQPEATPVSA